MKKRKDFNQASLVPVADENGVVVTKPVLKLGIPANTVVSFGLNASTCRNHDFSKYYGHGLDLVASAVQQTIEIILEESKKVEVLTTLKYCQLGFRYFADYLTFFAKAMGREMALSDITIELIENYIQHLKRSNPNGASAKTKYDALKSILVKMQSMGWLERFDFPRNPFPNSNRKKQGQSAFSKAERTRVAYALKADVNNILEKNEPLNGYELTIFLLAIALRSGMNTTPLLEMTIDSIQDHPLKENRKLLVLYKRRGNATHIQNLRNTTNVENAQTVLADVAVMVQHIIDMNQSLRVESGTDLVFTYRSIGNRNLGEITNISTTNLSIHIKNWVKEKDLKNDNGDPLQVNISRFRKTFVNRIFELSGGDPFVTAAAANHTLNVSQTHYHEAPKEAEKNFNYMGKVRTEELLSNIKVIENNTPVSKCSKIPNSVDSNGNKIYCTSFLDCVRCRNMVVTKEDLYRLFSFYWLIVSERKQIGTKRWSKYFAHIIRIIDRDIAPQFDADFVAKIKAEAQAKPHPAWKHRNQLEEVA